MIVEYKGYQGQVDDATGFKNYVGSSSNWIKLQNAKRTANELTVLPPRIIVVDKEGNYHAEATKRVSSFRENCFYSENNNTSFNEVAWLAEQKIGLEGRIGYIINTQEEEFSGEQLPIARLTRNVVLENRIDNASTYAYFITSMNKIQNAYIFTIAVSSRGFLYFFEHTQASPHLSLSNEDIQKIIKNKDRKNAAVQVNTTILKQQRWVYHSIFYNLPDGRTDWDYIAQAQLHDIIDEALWAMLWEIQANQTKVVVISATPAGSEIAQKKLAIEKLKEWKSQIQVQIQTANTTDNQSITVHNPQLQNTLPVYLKTIKDTLNMIYQLSGSAKDHEGNEKGTAQQSISEIKGQGGNQYETISIKQNLRNKAYSDIFKRMALYDKIELGNMEHYPEDFTVKVVFQPLTASDTSELLTLIERKVKLGIMGLDQALMEIDKMILCKEDAQKVLDEIMSSKEKYESLYSAVGNPSGDNDGPQDPNDPKNKTKPKEPKKED